MFTPSVLRWAPSFSHWCYFTDEETEARMGLFICSGHEARRWGNWCLNKWPDFRTQLLSSPLHCTVWRQFLPLLWIRGSSLGWWASQVVPVGKNTHTNVGDIKDTGSVPGSWRSPGGGHGNPLQDSCLENPMDRGAWQAAVHEVGKEFSNKLVSKQQQNTFIFSF